MATNNTNGLFDYLKTLVFHRQRYPKEIESKNGRGALIR